MMGTLQDDLDTLAAFRDRLDVLCDFDDIRSKDPAPGVLEASWRLLHHSFVVEPLRDPQANALVEMGALVLGAVGGHGRRALEELALGAVHPGHYPRLVPLLNTLTDGDGDLFFDVLLDAIGGDDPERAERALYLLRAGYGARFRFPIQPAQVAQLTAAVAACRALGTDHPGLAGALAGYIPPAPR